MPNAKKVPATKAATKKETKRVHPKLKIPKSVAQCADLLYTTRQTRLTEARAVAELAKDESVLKQHLIDTLPKGEASGIAGKVARVSISTTPVPSVDDKEKFWKWVDAGKGKRDAFIAPRAINMAALEELIDTGKALPPGVIKFNVVNVSINKI